MRDVLKTIEARAIALADEKFCEHYPPLVYFPNGDQEAEEPSHRCARPRLRIYITYSQRPCHRSFIDAIAAVREGLRENPDLQLTDLISWASRDFSVDPDQLTAAFSANA